MGTVCVIRARDDDDAAKSARLRCEVSADILNTYTLMCLCTPTKWINVDSDMSFFFCNALRLPDMT